MPHETIKVTPEMMKAITAPFTNFNKMWQQYASSQFRRDYLKSWAGEDPEKQRAVKELLDETTPM